MQKKWLAALLSAALLLGAACPVLAEEDPLAVLNAARMKSTAGGTDLSMYIGETVKVEGADGTLQSVDVQMEVNAKEELPKANAKISRSTDMTVTTAGISMKTSVYSDGDYNYVEIFGQKLKAEAVPAEVTGEAAEYEALLYKLNEASRLENLQLTRNEAGGAVIRFDLNAAKINEVLPDAMTGFAQSGLTAVYDEAAGTATISPDGCLLSLSLSVKLSIVGSDYASAAANCLYVFNNPGQQVTVTAPDLSQYRDVTQAAA